MVKMNLKILRKELKKLSEEYPDGELWTKVFFLFDEFESEFRKIVRQIEYEPAHSGFPTSYRYMEGWLDGVNFAIQKIKEVLGEEVSKK